MVVPKGILQKRKAALAALHTGDSVAFKHYLTSIQLRIDGKWRDAGDKLLRCGELFVTLKMFVEAATIYSEAAECFMKVDKSEALKTLLLSVKIYCDIGQFDVAGRVERRIAILHARSKHWEDAAIHYRKAANFFSGDGLIDQSDICLERAAECLVKMGEYDEANYMYETIAMSCVNTNLRRFQGTEKLLKSLFCMFGKAVDIDDELSVASSLTEGTSRRNKEPIEIPPVLDANVMAKYHEINAKMNEYDHVDFLWRTSKEKLLMKNLMKCRMEQDYSEFINHLYFWNNVHPFDDICLILLRFPVEELKQELERKKKIEEVRHRNRLPSSASIVSSISGDSITSKKLIPPL